MCDEKCGTCKYIGAENGHVAKLYGEPEKKLHFCNNENSYFRECLSSATACNQYISAEESEVINK